jgi:hypothetical protein
MKAVLPGPARPNHFPIKAKTHRPLSRLGYGRVKTLMISQQKHADKDKQYACKTQQHNKQDRVSGGHVGVGDPQTQNKTGPRHGYYQDTQYFGKNTFHFAAGGASRQKPRYCA